MDDLVKTMKAQLYDRVSSPLIFTFVLSWAVWNYRLILIGLSGATATDKFLQIDMLPLSTPALEIFWPVVTPYWAYWLLFSVIGPIAMTILYLCVLPYFEGMAYQLAQNKIVSLKKIKLKAENDVPLGQEEGRQLRQSLRDAEARWDGTMEAQKELLTKEKSAAVAQLKTLEIQSEAEKVEFERATAEKTQEINALKDQLQVALAAAKGAESKAAQIMFLEQGARELFDNLASSEKGLSLSDIRFVGNFGGAKEYLGQLVAMGLAELNGQTLTLTSFGERLHLERVLNAKTS